MASTYVNDLRIEEQATGENSGTWGTKVNSAFSQIAEAFSYGTKQLAADANETFTMPDGTSDGTRSLYLKITSAGSLTATRTVTLGPNTVSKLWIIENATTGSQSITIAQGSGGTVTIPTGAVKMVYSDGAGSGAAVVDALVDLDLTGTTKIATANIDGGSIDGTTIGASTAAAGTFTTGDFSGLVQFNGTAGIQLDNAAQVHTWALDDNFTSRLNIGTSSASAAWKIGSNNTAYLTVSPTGIDVTGTVTADGLTVASTGEVVSTVSSTSTSGTRGAKLRLNVASTGGDDPAGTIEFTYGTGYTVAGSIAMSHTNPNMKFFTGTTERMRIDNSGNVGIGLTNPSDYYAENLVVAAADEGGITIECSSNEKAYLMFADGTSGTAAYRGYLGYDHNIDSLNVVSSGYMNFFTADPQVEAMRIDSAGRLSINTAAASELLNVANTAGNGAGVEFAGNGNALGSTSAFYGQGSANDAYVWNRANSTLLFGTNNTERMRMFSNGDVTLGTSVRTFGPTTGRTCFEISGSDNSLFALSDTQPGSLTNRFYIHNDRGNGLITYLSQTGFDQRWYTGGGERMRLTNSGFFKAQADASYISATGNYHEFNSNAGTIVNYVRNTSASGSGIIVNCNNSDNTHYYFSGYSNSASATRIHIHTSGNIYNTNGTYGTLSDIKLKQDVVDAASQWDDIKDLRVRKFHMKDDPDGPLQLGLIAQEVEETSPGLVEELVDRDSENNDLGTTTKAVKYSILYMKAVKALQEAMDRIETLEAKVAQLEGAN